MNGSAEDGRRTYTFGDSDLARERLQLVADTFAPTTHQLLDDLPSRWPLYLLDLGCGPGFTTALLAAAFPMTKVTGYDSSEAMLEAARLRAPNAWFVAADVTRPLLLPADLIYARFLLGHLAEPEAALDTWAASLRPSVGTLACEEPVRYRTHDALFASYEAAVTAVVATTGARLWAGDVLAAEPAGCERVLDRTIDHPVPYARAAGMFWRNACVWGSDAIAAGVLDADDLGELISALQAREDERGDEVVMWEMRQTVWRRTA